MVGNTNKSLRGKVQLSHTHCIMIFTCAILLGPLARNLLDHAGMFLFKLMVKEGEGLKVKLMSGRIWKHTKEAARELKK